MQLGTSEQLSRIYLLLAVCNVAMIKLCTVPRNNEVSFLLY
jgi:hypothetical protein